MIKVKYFFEGKIYRLNGSRFDIENIKFITDNLQKRYAEFAERINEEGGYLEINISDTPNVANSIRYESFIRGVSQALLDLIYQ
jgi:hypothetical protein